MPKALPRHLKKYTVKQNYSRYTPEDQAVWRYVMRRLRNYLSTHAHACYLEGLKKTGLDSNQIPRVSLIDKKLRKFGWGAVPVSGFIPPAAFMEFQALGYLPIATEIRNPEHIDYTPAPDIIHEAAGHAPIIVDKEYANYLRQYALVAAKSIISQGDLNLYEAIRKLSDAKENPKSTPELIQSLETELQNASEAITEVSEAGLLSRMNWWTAEYGLIGDLNSPKIFGAGLLSSPGEAESCLSDSVKKIPLTVDCIKYSYDITEKQPQLFVTPSFAHLGKILRELQDTMAFVQAGAMGLQKAKTAQTVNTIELDTGLQISGILETFETYKDNVTFFKFKGPTQLGYKNRELKGHSTKYHKDGFSSPLGPLRKPVVFKKGSQLHLQFQSGIELKGRLVSTTKRKGKTILATFKDCEVRNGESILFAPEWGTFDLAIGSKVTSVFGGPADRVRYGFTDEFVAKIIPRNKSTARQQRLYKQFSAIRKLRLQRKASPKQKDQIALLWSQFQSEFFDHWLLGLEIFELLLKHKCEEQLLKDAMMNLETLPISRQARQSLNEGLYLLSKEYPELRA
jgi:phenylalanine-4-hydroxylase